MPTWSEIITAFDSKLNTSKSWNIFSTYNHNTSEYVYNTNCWAYGVDFTCHSVWNSQNNEKWNVTAINDHTVAWARHTNVQVGTHVRFVGLNGEVHNNEIASRHDVSGTYDITLGQLKYRLPSYIVPCSIYTGDDYTSYTPGVPALLVDNASSRALVYNFRPLNSDWASGKKASSFSDANFSSRLYFYDRIDNPSAGTSGSPCFLLINNELKLVSLIHDSGETVANGEFHKKFLTSINNTIISDIGLVQVGGVQQDCWMTVEFTNSLSSIDNSLLSNPSGIKVIQGDNEEVTCLSCYVEDGKMWMYFDSNIYYDRSPVFYFPSGIESLLFFSNTGIFHSLGSYTPIEISG